MKKEFLLPESDIEYLDTLGLDWETRIDNSNRWLIIYDFPVPKGYNIDKVNIALSIDGGYPVSQIDMAYFFPPLVKSNGGIIRALANARILSENWQRWSRHRTAVNPWRHGVDDISTHIHLVIHWLERELKK